MSKPTVDLNKPTSTPEKVLPVVMKMTKASYCKQLYWSL